MPIRRKGPSLEKIVARIPDEFAAGIPDTLAAIGVIVEAEVKRLLLTPGRGRMYGVHRASAPGDPPAPDLGNLQRSITHEVVGQTVRVGTTAEAAEALEFGTVTAGRGRNTVILPRPFMRPAIAATRDQVTDEIRKLMRGAKR
ncbi:MAG: hypothetical protein H0W30_01245 [Gemmatimonadaceae bacterium]|nr:hypothetical protein [Gemmatimonadaceae bacterium]MBA3557201.1 hypothetical protein [Gemmatimonadaceae bacterium]